MLKKIMIVTAAVGMGLNSPLLLSDEEFRLDNDVRQYSYAAGVLIGQQLLGDLSQQAGEIDIEAFRRGLSDILKQEPPLLNEEEMNAALQKRYESRLEEAIATANERKMLGDAYREQNRQAEGVTVLDNGMQYKVLKEGDHSGISPTLEDTVVVHYQGTLIDGTEFDSSYSRGEPTTFPLSQIIEGWKHLLPLMKPGDKWAVVIPPEYAYGEQGAGEIIGPNETLLFDIELIEVKTSNN